jgi:lipopolysaccharide/colanic/teichoic acid biosynthesis glycosyltransferase
VDALNADAQAVRRKWSADREARGRLLARRRFQMGSALVLAALLPYAFRLATIPGTLVDPPVVNALLGNTLAVLIASWIRLSITTYPGIRSSYVILPTALAAYAVVVAFFLMARLPYDRGALLAGLIIYTLWGYALYFRVERRTRPRIGIIPFGSARELAHIEKVDWLVLEQPRLHHAAGCSAFVADFAAEMPDEWEAFMADAALAGQIVYQVKQLSESLTGRVELDHLSENSFGSLLPARGWFHLKSVADFLFALLILPLALPVMALASIAIRLEDGGPALFRQARIGHAGRRITVYKFRTMRVAAHSDERSAAMTGSSDVRITRVGAFLRRYRVDELPQIINVLKNEMSWIGPRPEAEILSIWYTSELPFYRYRHVVKPGISGWAQVNQGHVAEVHEVHRKLQYDFYYIKYFSPWLDLLILFRTVRTMLTGFGAR